MTIPAADAASGPALDATTPDPATLGHELRVERVRAMRGPNLFRLAPVIACELTVGRLDELSAAQAAAIVARISALEIGDVDMRNVDMRDVDMRDVDMRDVDMRDVDMRDVDMRDVDMRDVDMRDADMRDADMRDADMREARWARAVARLAAGLQRAAGARVDAWHAVTPAGADGIWGVAAGYEEEDAGLESVWHARDVVRACIAGDDELARGRVARAIGDLRERLQRTRPGASAALIMAAARARGIPVRRAPGDAVVQLGTGSRLRRIGVRHLDVGSATGVRIAASSRETRDLLDRLGLPTLPGATVGSLEVAVDEADDIGLPVRVRSPRAPGDGIAPRVAHTVAEVRDAVAAVLHAYAAVVIERHTPGRDHSLLVVGGRVIAAAEWADGAWVDRTADVHPDTAAACAYAADVVGLDVGAVWLRTADVTAPWGDGAAIVEVSASPDLQVYAGDVAGAVLDLLFPQRAAVPLVAITGTNGKTTTTRLIAHLFRASGTRVGFTTTDGVYLGEHMLLEDDMTGPMAADMVLSNPRVDVAVLETARGGILRAGLGFDACDVAVVLNVSPDHLGLAGVHTVQALADVKSLLVSAVRADGHAVLNADDPLVLAMRARAAGRVAPFTLRSAADAPEVVAEARSGGLALTVDDGAFVLHAGDVATRVADVADVPLTMGGAARFQVQNVAGAILAAACGGVSVDHIRAGLATFGASAAMTPGRMNVVRTRGATVILDYAHNVAAIGALIDYALRVPAARRLVALHSPGDRRDEDIRAVGRLGAPLDVVILKEDPAIRRGRAPGETIRLMREGLDSAAGRPEIIEVLEEPAAVDELVARLRPGDLAIFITAEARAVTEALDSAG